MLDADRGLEGVVEGFLPYKKIYVKSFRHMPTRTEKELEKRWNAYEDGFFELLADSSIRSILLDTDTEAWEMIRMHYLGKLTQVKPQQYAEVNAAFRRLIDAAYDSDKNLILIARYKKQYVRKNNDKNDSAWNGLFEPAGFSELPYLVQANLRTRLVIDEAGELKPSVEVINCRQNMALSGEIFEYDEACFPWVAANIIDGTSPDDWE